MKAILEHQDLNGTIAAEMTETYHHSLQTYMEQHIEGFDTTRFYCRGCQIDMEDGEETFGLRFACFDKQTRRFVLFVTDRKPLTELPKILKKVQIVLGVQMHEVFVDDEDIVYAAGC